MNIKRASTVELAREVAALTGESVTSAVETALAERLARLRAADDDAAAARVEAARSARIREIVRDMAEHWGDDPRTGRELQDELYDELGLPQ